MGNGERRRREGGFTYIALLIGMAVIGIGLSAVSEVWSQTRLREKEDELLFIGDQFRMAITRYYLQSPPAARRFPMKLEELLEDGRSPDKPLRHLRKLYPDPMTMSKNWGELRLPNGQLVGVYSLSNEAPFKVYGFAQRDQDFAGKDRYADWTFRSTLPAANPVLAAGGSYMSGGATPSGPANTGSKTPAAVPNVPLAPIMPMQTPNAPSIRPLPRPRLVP